MMGKIAPPPQTVYYNYCIIFLSLNLNKHGVIILLLLFKNNLKIKQSYIFKKKGNYNCTTSVDTKSQDKII